MTKCITCTKSNRKIFLSMAIKTLGCMQTKCSDSKNIGIRPISSGNENKFTAEVPKKLVVFLRNLSTFYDRDNRWLPMLVLAEGRGGDAYNSFYASCHQPDQLRILNQSVRNLSRRSHSCGVSIDEILRMLKLCIYLKELLKIYYEIILSNNNIKL
ncbi:unnamed protein product [Euphydryas editha]|uniref:Uncharacterized protein n=1 Tax=Euphydryas editha TaxID=104508 RepID=A0AAU9V0S6_EUPED|nr:unnamed protein product [Euphydryas editha]